VVPLMALGPFVIILSGHGPLDVINWMGTTATFGFMLAYLLVAIAAPLYLYRRVSRTSPLSWWGSSAR